MGIGCTREEERSMAALGKMEYAPSVFEDNQSVMNAGVLLALPALISQGLEDVFKLLNPLPKGYYGIKQMILIMCFMALCRIKSIEELKKYSPGELGKLIGLDRIPETGSFRIKLHQIIEQNKSEEIQTTLLSRWLEDLPEMFFYIDGHVRVYHGEDANLTKKFVSREKLCLSGTTEFWVHDSTGMPLMFINGELTEKLKDAVEQAIPKILKEIKSDQSKNKITYTLIFDREGYEPQWFKKLFDKYKVAIITYRKNVQDAWPVEWFKDTEIQTNSGIASMQLCEMGTQLQGTWFREVRRLTKSGHQTAIITTNNEISLDTIAAKMFLRWIQENFFKYMLANFNFDNIVEYGTEAVNQNAIVPNPIYSRLSSQIKKAVEKKRRLEASIYEITNNMSDSEKDQAKKILKTAPLIDQINIYEIEIEKLKANRNEVPARISVAEMTDDARYNKLKTESKKLKNIILMLTYRAETAMYKILNEIYKYNDKDGRMILKEVFTKDADMVCDSINKKLYITIHTLSNPRTNKAIDTLCGFMNLTSTVYPGTDLVVEYKLHAN
jgi:hypothetical protein